MYRLRALRGDLSGKYHPHEERQGISQVSGQLLELHVLHEGMSRGRDFTYPSACRRRKRRASYGGAKGSDYQVAYCKIRWK